MLYNMVYRNTVKSNGKVQLGKYGHKHFDSIDAAEQWAKDNKVSLVSLQIWEADIDCFNTIKRY